MSDGVDGGDLVTTIGADPGFYSWHYHSTKPIVIEDVTHSPAHPIPQAILTDLRRKIGTWERQRAKLEGWEQRSVAQVCRKLEEKTRWSSAILVDAKKQTWRNARDATPRDTGEPTWEEYKECVVLEPSSQPGC